MLGGSASTKAHYVFPSPSIFCIHDLVPRSSRFLVLPVPPFRPPLERVSVRSQLVQSTTHLQAREAKLPDALTLKFLIKNPSSLLCLLQKSPSAGAEFLHYPFEYLHRKHTKAPMFLKESLTMYYYFHSR
jgi:hypothetical protein